MNQHFHGGKRNYSRKETGSCPRRPECISKRRTSTDCASHILSAIEIEKENGDTLWWDAILKEMRNVRPAFEAHRGNKEDLPPGYQ